MRHRTATAAGRALYKLRQQTVEPVFGIIKAAMGFRRFSLRGLEKVNLEWDLVCLAYNVRRLHTLKIKIPKGLEPALRRAGARLKARLGPLEGGSSGLSSPLPVDQGPI